MSSISISMFFGFLALTSNFYYLLAKVALTFLPKNIRFPQEKSLFNQSSQVTQNIGPSV